MTPLALSLGDPAGIGPEIVAGAWAALKSTGPVFIVVGDAAAVERAGAPVTRVNTPEQATLRFGDTVPVLDDPAPSPVTPGEPDPAAGPAIARWIETAARLALAGEASGIVTAPIAKASLYESGFAYPGHTEFLGALARPIDQGNGVGPVMMLAAADLRVSLVTIHEPLSRVPGLLTIERILNAGLVTAEALRRDFAIPAARLAVCGLNPHAGETGTIGREEVDVIAPAVEALRARGVDASGPSPSDSLFHPDARARYDAALCLYHDQALIPVKMLDFWGGVNITLGLPIVRTSPDHGTGFDIAGQGLARPDSLIAALRLADVIARNRSAGRG